MTEEEIKILTPNLRILGYLKRLFALNECELKIKTKYQIFDGTWQSKTGIEENAAWKSLLEDLMPWWYALTLEELESIEPIEKTGQSLTSNEYPFPKLIRVGANIESGPYPIEISNS